jgi:hypothetical protein
LQAGDVTSVLNWVPHQSEPEGRAAFARILKIRVAGREANGLADTYFFETLVRLHSAGEGKPYTGLKPAGTLLDPALAAADQALANGSADLLVRTLTEQVAHQIRRCFDNTTRARKAAEISVEAGREYVQAYVGLMHYLELLDQTQLRGDGAPVR